jgi:hypothetical protein
MSVLGTRGFLLVSVYLWRRFLTSESNRRRLV